MRHYAGREAIRAWLAKEIAGDRVTMFVTETLRHPGGVTVLAKVTGHYDKSGLPDPLELRFYFTLAGDAIAQLVVIPAKRPLSAGRAAPALPSPEGNRPVRPRRDSAETQRGKALRAAQHERASASQTTSRAAALFLAADDTG
jgi:hypothetical protein